MTGEYAEPDETRFLAILYEVLDDLGSELRHLALNKPMQSHLARPISILAALATRDQSPAPVPGAIECSDLESFRQALYEPSDIQADTSSKDVGLNCCWCGVWQPIGNMEAVISDNLRADAPVDLVTDSSCGEERRRLHEEVIDIIPEGDWQHAEILEPPVPDECSNNRSVDAAIHQSQTLHSPMHQSPQMPRLEFSTIRDIGAAVACSWELAELLQPYLALVIELGGGSVSTFTP